MDLMKMGKELLGDKLADSGALEGLSKLTGGGDGLDLGALTDKLKAAGLGGKLDSWLGDGDNEAVSGEEIKNALGADKVAEMASSMGVDEDTAANQLTDLLPNLLDKASSGGSLLDKFGGASAALDAAKGFLNK
ncbi:MAG: DUF937 domain-containing protein [Gammaproteobacteria bacterium]|nr:DUF937 domain-containing protein [Gammaproteobacteria bacterium]